MNINVESDWIKNQLHLNHSIIKIDTVPVVDKWPRTKFPSAGLHRPIGHFQIKNYVECFVQSAVQELRLAGKQIVVGGIGNKLSNKLLLKIVRVVAANGIQKVFSGERGVMTRPSISALCAKHCCWGFFIHVACNPVPDYKEKIIGLDLIDPDGGLINPDKVNAVLAGHQRVCAYYTIPTISFSHWKNGHKHFVVNGKMFAVEVVDTVVEYTNTIKTMFEFDKIGALLNGEGYLRPLRLTVDCNDGAVGPYAKRIFVDELGVPSTGSVIKWKPNDDVTTFHPSHVPTMDVKTSAADMSVCLDPDGSRCVVFGSQGFLVPSGETLSIMALHYQAIPHYQKKDFAGVGRSFLTCSSVDDIAKKAPLTLVRVPGRWIYFRRQIQSGEVSFAENDDFAVGSSYNAMSDGIWVILMWLSLIIHLYKPVQNIITDHWLVHGRHFMSTYEFHRLPKSSLDHIMKKLQYHVLTNPDFLSSHQIGNNVYQIVKSGNFPFCFKLGTEMMHEDSTLRIEFVPKSLVIFKSIVAGDSGTLKIVVEVYSKSAPYSTNKQKVTNPLFNFAVKLSHVDICAGKTSADAVY